jgi:putative PIN family toxin of toxin-antitoxin system
MRVVLDTNVLFASASKTSRHHIIFDSFLEGQYILLLSNDVLTEYEEIITAKAGSPMSNKIMELLLNSPNVELHSIFYKWNLIDRDKDDNKFADLYIAANGDYLVTNDTHFNEVKMLKFPPINVVTLEEFKTQLTKSK